MKRKTTEELLAESFLELAESKRIDKITITEITNNCGMSQPTFYNHFKDKYDLIVWIYTSRVSEVMGRIDNKSYLWKDTLLDGARYYAENSEFIKNALKHTSGQDSFIDRILDLGGEVKNGAKKEEPIFTDVVEFIKYDLQTSKDGLAWLKELTEEAMDDYSTFDMLKTYYQDEEEDMYWAEQQLELIEKIGLQNWLNQQL